MKSSLSFTSFIDYPFSVISNMLSPHWRSFWFFSYAIYRAFWFCHLMFLSAICFALIFVAVLSSSSRFTFFIGYAVVSAQFLKFYFISILLVYRGYIVTFTKYKAYSIPWLNSHFHHSLLSAHSFLE
jgi:hypothetical protein